MEHKDKKPIVVGRIQSGRHRFHIEDDVYDAKGICRPLTHTDYKHPVRILEVRSGEGNETNRKYL